MATTNEILEAVRSRLEALPLSAEFWPEEDKEYYLAHPTGAAMTEAWFLSRSIMSVSASLWFSSS